MDQMRIVYMMVSIIFTAKYKTYIFHNSWEHFLLRNSMNQQRITGRPMEKEKVSEIFTENSAFLSSKLIIIHISLNYVCYLNVLHNCDFKDNKAKYFIF